MKQVKKLLALALALTMLLALTVTASADGKWTEEETEDGWIKVTNEGGKTLGYWPDSGVTIIEDDGLYSCVGHDGQQIFIIPSKDLVVVILGYSPKPDHEIDFNRLLKDIIRNI